MPRAVGQAPKSRSRITLLQHMSWAPGASTHLGAGARDGAGGSARGAAYGGRGTAGEGAGSAASSADDGLSSPVAPSSSLHREAHAVDAAAIPQPLQPHFLAEKRAGLRNRMFSTPSSVGLWSYPSWSVRVQRMNRVNRVDTNTTSQCNLSHA